MFCQLVTVGLDRYSADESNLRLMTNPPDGLLAAVSWRDGESARTLVVWDSPKAAGDFAERRVMPLLESGELTPVHPERVVVLDTFIRGSTDD